MLYIFKLSCRLPPNHPWTTKVARQLLQAVCTHTLLMQHKHKQFKALKQVTEERLYGLGSDKKESELFLASLGLSISRRHMQTAVRNSFDAVWNYVCVCPLKTLGRERESESLFLDAVDVWTSEQRRHRPDRRGKRRQLSPSYTAAVSNPSVNNTVRLIHIHNTRKHSRCVYDTHTHTRMHACIQIHMTFSQVYSITHIQHMHTDHNNSYFYRFQSRHNVNSTFIKYVRANLVCKNIVFLPF